MIENLEIHESTTSTSYEEVRALKNDILIEDEELQYKLTELEDLSSSTKIHNLEMKKNYNLRLPCRLNSPLIPLPAEIGEFLSDDNMEKLSILNDMSYSHIYSLYSYIRKNNVPSIPFYSKFSTISGSFIASMDLISKQLTRQLQTEIQSEKIISSKFVYEAVNLDFMHAISDSSMKKIDLMELPTIPSIMYFINKIRFLITLHHDDKSLITEPYFFPNTRIFLRMHANGIYELSESSDTMNWSMLLADRFSVVYTNKLNSIVICPSTYLDYYLSRQEVVFNLDIIVSQEDYKYYRLLANYLKRLVTQLSDHNKVVDFMKNYEGFLNITADFSADNRNTAGPYFSIIEEMIEISISCDGVQVNLDEVLSLLFLRNESLDKDLINKAKYSMMLSLCLAIRGLNAQQLIEASSFHKFCFYAEIDEIKGVEKFIKRTHTKRKVSEKSKKVMRCIFNKTYILSYFRRYKKIPKIYPFILKTNGDQEEDDNAINQRTIIQSKIDILMSTSNKYSLNHVLDKELIWWYDLRPYNCEDKLELGNPIEYAKDKRSCKPEITHSLLDSEKELESIIRAEHISYPTIPKSIINNFKEQKYYKVNQGVSLGPVSYPTMLKEKEREQKVEGRLFGMNTTELKQTISRYMKMAKHVLSYFSGNLMTPTDKERKEKMHRMAQLLLRNENYAIMADVEGHNQSMQPENTEDLLTSIGLCYGEDDWSKLAYLYPNLHVFYPMQHLDSCLVSEGQLGGIEGWFNPVWTLHTLITCQSISYLSSINVIEVAVYSDDIALIVKLEKFDNNLVNQLLKNMKEVFLSFGMNLKLIQTTISKFRLTMLRQHYIMGNRADSTCKKMLSMSSFSSQLLHLDDIEVASVMSAASSALELSNHVTVQVIQKWYRYILLTLRQQVSSLATPLDMEILNLMSESTKVMYREQYPDCRDKVSNNNWLYQDLASKINEKENSWIKDRIIDRLRKGRIESKSSIDMKLFQHKIIERLISDEGYRRILFYRSLFPLSLGGDGMMSLEQCALTGMSDNLGRSLSTIHSISTYDERGGKIARIMLANALGTSGKGKNLCADDEDDDYGFKYKDKGLKYYDLRFKGIRLMSSEWPESQRATTSNDMIRRMLLRLLKRICNNQDLKQLLKNYDLADKRKEMILEELKDNFSHRIAKFYGENTVDHIVDKLIRKVEATSSLLKSCKDLYKVMKTCSNFRLRAMRILITKPLFTFGEIDIDTKMQEYLFSRRSYMYGDIKFVDAIEPEVNSFMKKSDQTNWFITSILTSGTKYNKGVSEYLPPIFGSEALYKGETHDIDETFSNLKEAMLIKVISVSKWIIFRSNPNEYLENIKVSTNISNCADICLLSLGYNRFLTYEQHVPLLSRSEVLHRIPLLDANPHASIRILPQITPKFRATINTKMVLINDLKDSNLHFDYFRLKTILSATLSTAMGSDFPFIEHWSLANSDLIRDVQFNFLKRRSQVIYDIIDVSMYSTKEDSLSTRISWICDNLSMISEGIISAISPSEVEVSIPRNDITAVVKQITKEYVYLLQLENLWDSIEIWSDNYLRPLYDKYIILYNKANINCINDLKYHIIKWVNDELALKQTTAYDEIRSKPVLHAKYAYISLMTNKDEQALKLLDNMTKFLNRLSWVEMDDANVEKNMMELIEKNSHDMSEALKLLYCLPFIENYIELSYENGMYFMIYKGLAEKIEQYFLSDNLKNKIDEKLYYICKFCLSRLSKLELDTKLRETISDFSDFILDHVYELEKQDLSLSKINHVKNIAEIQLTDLPNSRLNCYAYSITEKAFDGNTIFPNLIKEFENINKIKSDVSVFNSATGSDIYVTAISVLTFLKERCYLENDSIIYDLTAGRGDWAFAAEVSGISYRGFARADRYNMIYHHRLVEYKEELDIKDCNSYSEIFNLMNMEKKNDVSSCKILALIDLSFSSVTNVELDNFSMAVITEGYDILIRLNSNKGEYIGILNMIKEEKMSGIMILSGNDDMQSPYIYVLLTNPRKARDRFNIYSTNNLVIYKMLSIVRYKYSVEPSMHISERYYMNSSIDKIRGMGHNDSSLLFDIENISEYIANRSLRKLKPNLNLIKSFPIPEELGTYFASRMTWDEIGPLQTLKEWRKKIGPIGNLLINEKQLQIDKGWINRKVYNVNITGMNREMFSKLYESPISKKLYKLLVPLLKYMNSEDMSTIPEPDTIQLRVVDSEDLRPMWKSRISKPLLNAYVLLIYDYYGNFKGDSYRLYKYIRKKNPKLGKEMEDTIKIRRLLSQVETELSREIRQSDQNKIKRNLIVNWIHENLLSRMEHGNLIIEQVKEELAKRVEDMRLDNLDIDDAMQMTLDFAGFTDKFTGSLKEDGEDDEDLISEQRREIDKFMLGESEVVNVGTINLDHMPELLAEITEEDIVRLKNKYKKLSFENDEEYEEKIRNMFELEKTAMYFQNDECYEEEEEYYEYDED